jgi:hypothetical protein
MVINILDPDQGLDPDPDEQLWIHNTEKYYNKIARYL